MKFVSEPAAAVTKVEPAFESRRPRHLRALAEDTGSLTIPHTERIVCLSLNFAPEEIGIGPVITPVMQALSRHADSVDVVTTRPYYPNMTVPTTYARGDRDREQVDNLSIHRVKARPPKTSGLFGRMRHELSYFFGILWLRLSGRVRSAPTVVSVCPTIFAVLLAPLFLRRGGTSICFVYDIQSGLGQALGLSRTNLLVRAVRFIERFAFNRCSRLIVLSDKMKEALIENGVRSEIFVMPPQVDTDQIAPEPEPESGPPLLLYSGNLGLKQGLMQLIDLAENLEARRREFRLVLRGDGSQREALAREIERRALKSVSIEPLRARDRLSESLGEAIIHLVPQIPEGSDAALPSKIFTIMAAGRAFIATAYSGSPLAYYADTVGSCLCVDPFDTPALAEAVELLIENRGKRRMMGERGRLFVEMNVSHKVALDRLCQIVLTPEPQSYEVELAPDRPYGALGAQRREQASA